VIGTDSKPCPAVASDINGAEPFGSATSVSNKILDQYTFHLQKHMPSFLHFISFIYVLFNETVSSSDYVVSNGRMWN
jgi:hypothetical protein